MDSKMLTGTVGTTVNKFAHVGNFVFKRLCFLTQRENVTFSSPNFILPRLRRLLFAVGELPFCRHLGSPNLS